MDARRIAIVFGAYGRPLCMRKQGASSLRTGGVGRFYTYSGCRRVVWTCGSMCGTARRCVATARLSAAQRQREQSACPSHEIGTSERGRHTQGGDGNVATTRCARPMGCVGDRGKGTGAHRQSRHISGRSAARVACSGALPFFKLETGPLLHALTQIMDLAARIQPPRVLKKSIRRKRSPCEGTIIVASNVAAWIGTWGICQRNKF